MSDTAITRDALEEMGFEFAHQNYAFVKVGEIVLELWFDYDSPKFDGVILRFPSGCQHIHKPNDLPALRRLIRSLFGDDALPRRELSSITDEELKNLFNIVSGDDYRPDEIIESKRMESCWNVGILDYIIVSLSDLGLVSHFPNDFYHDEVTPEAYNYLVNELDFHLPAFRDDKGG